MEDEKQTDFDNLSDDELMKQMRELEQQIAKRKKKQKILRCENCKAKPILTYKVDYDIILL